MCYSACCIFRSYSTKFVKKNFTLALRVWFFFFFFGFQECSNLCVGTFRGMEKLYIYIYIKPIKLWGTHNQIPSRGSIYWLGDICLTKESFIKERARERKSRVGAARDSPCGDWRTVRNFARIWPVDASTRSWSMRESTQRHCIAIFTLSSGD